MHIIRLETNDGKGIYQEGLVWDAGIATEPRWHPSPHDENLPYRSNDKMRDYHFGFKGARTYLQWFYKPEWRSRFLELGVTLQVYKVDAEHVISTESQLIFLKHNAELVCSLPPTLFDIANGKALFPEVWELLDHAN